MNIVQRVQCVLLLQYVSNVNAPSSLPLVSFPVRSSDFDAEFVSTLRSDKGRLLDVSFNKKIYEYSINIKTIIATSVPLLSFLSKTVLITAPIMIHYVLKNLAIISSVLTTQNNISPIFAKLI